MDKAIQNYLATIGAKGGRKSRRVLEPDTAQKMVKVREARRAYKKFHTQCFWSFDPNYKITVGDLSWISEQLKKNGGREAWLAGVKLCR